MAAPSLLRKFIGNIWLALGILIFCVLISLYLLLQKPDTGLRLGTELSAESARTLIIVVVFVLGIIINSAINLITGHLQKEKRVEPQIIVPPIENKIYVNSQPETKPVPFSTVPDQKFYPTPFLPDLKFFVGRKEVLRKIKATLSKDHRAVIHDISGLGKTFTCYKFVEENQSNYNKIFLIRATKEEMLESLAKCGEMVDAALAETTEQKIKAGGFKQWLEENEKWLVVYDNVDEPAALHPYVPISKNGDCLFTSNFREVVNLGTEIDIVKLERSDAENLLYRRANNKPLAKPELEDEERKAFDRLIKEIDGLPLTLNSSGAYIFQKDLTFSRFWEKYEKTPEIAWESEDSYSAYQRRSAGFVFSLAYDELSVVENTGEALKTILDSVSFISPDEIPEDLLQKILEEQYSPYAEAKDPDDLWDNVREKLTTYDLLKYDRQKRTFTTHRAIQRVIQSRLKGKEKDICIALASVLRGLFPVYDYTNREECEKYYQHVLVLVGNADRFGVETGDTNELYAKLRRYQRLMGNYALAERFSSLAAEISAAVFGRESEVHARDLNELAIIYGYQGKYDEAIEKYEEALRIGENTIGREHPDYATRLNNLGEIYRALGRYDEAIEKYDEALRIGEKTIGSEHPDYATRLNNLGEVYRVQGRHDEALEKYDEALRIDEKTIGREHPHYALRLNNLAAVYYAQGRYDEAIEKCEEALRIDEKTIGREHPDYALRLNNLANVYLARGEMERAEKLYGQAREIREKTLGKLHPGTALNYWWIGVLRFEQERYAEALPMLEEAYRQYVHFLGGEHPDTKKLKSYLEICRERIRKLT
jgi:tetratricopeptide (TPR) repeat protein